MLAVLSNSGRNALPLALAEEELLDDWVAGRLSVADADRAAALTRRNALAAERVLERRLLDAARKSPPVPQTLTARVLAPTPSPRTSSSPGSWWRSFGRRQWLGIAAVAALAGIAAIAVAPMLQQALRGDSAVQVAMVAFADRTPLFESSDVRVRGPGTPQVPPGDQRFRDIALPTATLRSLAGPVGPSQAAALTEIEALLPAAKSSPSSPLRLVLDEALKNRIEAANGPTLPVRLYDLNDPRSVDIRRQIPNPPAETHIYLLTTRP